MVYINYMVLETDMGELNDHDILIRLDENMRTMITNHTEFVKEVQALTARVAILENKDSRDSEKFRGITDEIRRSLNNSARIESMTSDLNNLGEKVRALDTKSFRWDIAVLIGTIIAGVIAWFH